MKASLTEFITLYSNFGKIIIFNFIAEPKPLPKEKEDKTAAESGIYLLKISSEINLHFIGAA